MNGHAKVVLMFGLPGLWCTRQGIRNILHVGRTPHDDEDKTCQP